MGLGLVVLPWGAALSWGGGGATGGTADAALTPVQSAGLLFFALSVVAVALVAWKGAGRRGVAASSPFVVLGLTTPVEVVPGAHQAVLACLVLAASWLLIRSKRVPLWVDAVHALALLLLAARIGMSLEADEAVFGGAALGAWLAAGALRLKNAVPEHALGTQRALQGGGPWAQMLLAGAYAVVGVSCAVLAVAGGTLSAWGGALATGAAAAALVTRRAVLYGVHAPERGDAHEPLRSPAVATASFMSPSGSARTACAPRAVADALIWGTAAVGLLGMLLAIEAERAVTPMATWAIAATAIGAGIHVASTPLRSAPHWITGPALATSAGAGTGWITHHLPPTLGAPAVFLPMVGVSVALAGVALVLGRSGRPAPLRRAGLVNGALAWLVALAAGVGLLPDGVTPLGRVYMGVLSALTAAAAVVVILGRPGCPEGADGTQGGDAGAGACTRNETRVPQGSGRGRGPLPAEGLGLTTGQLPRRALEALGMLTAGLLVCGALTDSFNGAALALCAAGWFVARPCLAPSRAVGTDAAHVAVGAVLVTWGLATVVGLDTPTSPARWAAFLAIASGVTASSMRHPAWGKAASRLASGALLAAAGVLALLDGRLAVWLGGCVALLGAVEALRRGGEALGFGPRGPCGPGCAPSSAPSDARPIAAGGAPRRLVGARIRVPGLVVWGARASIVLAAFHRLDVTDGDAWLRADLLAAGTLLMGLSLLPEARQYPVAERALHWAAAGLWVLVALVPLTGEPALRAAQLASFAALVALGALRKRVELSAVGLAGLIFAVLRFAAGATMATLLGLAAGLFILAVWKLRRGSRGAKGE
ncbi:hypothetical protein [Falsarthrobacter nasiphocae]|uniref:Uncharacterized protein n=1 Tax=Falsarthrobacter nasiphocae TaxID=189863 RepID=A0AAE3YG27_9MICC|nr:hypothetical protein [Falsarthrobacter nasiphocae]MDR6892515.1 hypothetical protein [Falsarthrobacter nasiphocae]